MVNQGKGAAVKIGTLYSRGEHVLMLDADGATDFHEIEGIYKRCLKVASGDKNNFACVIGSRNINTGQVKRSPLRKFLNFAMQKMCFVVLGSALKDTQCGFKIWSREAAQRVFAAQHLERWAFDLEVLFVSYRYETPVVEVPVKWEDVEGSHLDVVDASTQMIRDMILIKSLYAFGVWKINDYHW